MRSRVIDKSAALDAGRWDFPAVDATAADALRGASKTGAHLLTANQLETLERQVKDEARQRGYEEGLAAGKAEAAARATRLDGLISAFTHPFQALEQRRYIRRLVQHRDDDAKLRHYPKSRPC